MDIFNHRKAYVGYLTAGSQDLNYQVEASLALEKGGVDILEVGFPFSDPVADGPVIQQAMDMALRRNTNGKDVLELIRKIREYSSMPMVLFSYCNPLLQLGSAFLQDVYHAGAESLLLIDLPFEEKQVLKSPLQRICVTTPATSNERVKIISDHGKGFLYYACRKGTTGVKSAMPEGYQEDVQRMKKFSELPVVAGFGIGSKASAKEAVLQADGFVVGSLFVKSMQEGLSPNELQALAASIDPREKIHHGVHREHGGKRILV